MISRFQKSLNTLSSVDLVQHLKDVFIPLLSILIISLSVFSLPRVEVGSKILDEKLRQYFWFLIAETKINSPLNTSILDLYTSETYNSSPKEYSNRYRSYDLANSLDVYCKLGTKKVAFDFFIDEETWIGKHLSSNNTDSRELISSLSCFKTILLPIRETQDNWILPIEKLASLDNVSYVHVETLDSVVYKPSKTSNSPKGQLSVPYIANALAKTNEIQTDQLLQPILMKYAPSSFTRLRYEDLEIFKPLNEVLSESRFKEFYQRYFSAEKGTYPLPDTVLVGFTHDAQDQHDVAFNKAGPLSLPRVESNSKAHQRSSFDSPRTHSYGNETPVAFTPGVYIIASSSNLLSQADTAKQFLANDLVYVVSFLAFLFAVMMMATQVSSSLKISLIFTASLLISMLFAFALLKYELVLIPITFPIAVIIILWIYTDFKYGSGLMRRLIQMASKKGDNYKPKKPIDCHQPNLILIAQSQRDSQIDNYKKLVSSIDILSFWIQFISLLAVAEHFGSNNKSLYGSLSKKDWTRWARPTLGTYLFGFKKLVSKGKTIKNASQDSMFPQFTNLMNKREQSELEKLLLNSLDLRNEWKHFASSCHSEQLIESTLNETHSTEQLINQELSFLNDYLLIKTKQLKPCEKNTYYWDCLVYSGSTTFIDTFATADELQPDTLYLFNVKKWGRFSNTLCLEPWIVAEECTHHHREEIFFYTGLIWDPQQRKLTTNINYAGLTDSCKPANTYEVSKEIYKLFHN